MPSSTLEELAHSLTPVRLEVNEATATILFRVSGVVEEGWLVELTATGSRLLSAGSTAHADLTIFCDPRQLQSILEEGFSERALQWSGRRELLERLRTLLRTSK